MEELVALSEKIVADGGKPWCIGLGSGGATGWPATDWVEDIMLRTQIAGGLRQVGDQRDQVRFARGRRRDRDLRHRSPRTTPRSMAVRRAWPRPTSATARRASSRPPPKCYMHRQASFIPSFFPEGTDARRGCRLLLLPGLCRPSPISASRCSVPARWSPSPRTPRPRAPSSSS